MGTARNKNPASLYVFIAVITFDCDSNGGREHRPLVVHSVDFLHSGLGETLLEYCSSPCEAEKWCAEGSAQGCSWRVKTVHKEKDANLPTRAQAHHASDPTP